MMWWVMKQDLTNVTVVKVEAAEVKQQVTVLIGHELTGKAQLRPLHDLKPKLQSGSSVLHPKRAG